MRSFSQTWTRGFVATVTLILSTAAVGSLALFVAAAVAGIDDAPLWAAYTAPLWVPLGVALGLNGLRAGRL